MFHLELKHVSFEQNSHVKVTLLVEKLSKGYLSLTLPTHVNCAQNVCASLPNGGIWLT